MKGVDFFHPNPFLRPNTLSSTSPLQVLQSLLFPWNWVSCVFYQSSHLWSEGWLNYEGGNIGSLLLMVFEWKLMEVWLFWNLMFFFLPSFMLHLMYDSPSSGFWAMIVGLTSWGCLIFLLFFRGGSVDLSIRVRFPRQEPSPWLLQTVNREEIYTCSFEEDMEVHALIAGEASGSDIRKRKKRNRGRKRKATDEIREIRARDRLIDDKVWLYVASSSSSSSLFRPTSTLIMCLWYVCRGFFQLSSSPRYRANILLWTTKLDSWPPLECEGSKMPSIKFQSYKFKALMDYFGLLNCVICNEVQ